MVTATTNNQEGAAEKRQRIVSNAANIIADAIDAGVMPWQAEGVPVMPVSIATGRPYMNVNFLVLSSKSFFDPRWGSFFDAKKSEWKIKKGETGIAIPNLRDGELTEYFVFNAKQMSGAPRPQFKPRNEDPLGFAQALLERSGATTKVGARLRYDHAFDTIILPDSSRYLSSDRQAMDVIRGLVMWGAGRDSKGERVSVAEDGPQFIKRLLASEIATSMICAMNGIHMRPNDSTSHMSSAMAAMTRSNGEEIFKIANKARGICEYINQFTPVNSADSLFDDDAALFGAPSKPKIN